MLLQPDDEMSYINDDNNNSPYTKESKTNLNVNCWMVNDVNPCPYIIQETHKMYLQKLDEISKLQKTCSSSISSQQKRLKEMSHLVKK